MDSPFHAEANVIGAFSKLLSPVKNSNTLRLLKNILDGHIESINSNNDSFMSIGAPIKSLQVDSPMKYQEPQTIVTDVGTLLLQVSSDFDECQIKEVVDDQMHKISVMPASNPVLEFVEMLPNIPIEDDIIKGILNNIQNLQMYQPHNGLQAQKVSYIWINSLNRPYRFGHVSHPPMHFSLCPSIEALMDTINKHLGGYDSCLITM